MSVLDAQQTTAPQSSPNGSEARPKPIIIQPSQGWVALRLQDLWEYRELLFFLVWRDVKVRYKQTRLGVTWAIIQPVLTMIVFSIFFGRLAGLDSAGIPYPIATFAALLPWQLFSLALINSSNSLVNSANLIRKVYFPRMAVPIATVLAGLVDFAIAFVILLGLMVYYGIAPTLATITLPLLILLTLVTALGVGLWLSALNVQYRDVRHAVPFLSQLWMFASPVVYSSTLLPEPWRTLYGLNPMVGVIEGFRWALLGKEAPSAMILISAVVAVLVLISGMVYFRRVERGFADIV